MDDLARAATFLMREHSSEDIVNIGLGEDISILELAQQVADVVGYTGRIETDPSKPDGTPRKLLDVSRINGLGWRASTPLADGIAKTYRYFLSQQS